MGVPLSGEAGGQYVVQPGKHQAADKTVCESPSQPDDTARRAYVVPPIQKPEESHLSRGAFESDYPPGQAEQAQTPYKCTRESERPYVQSQIISPFCFPPGAAQPVGGVVSGPHPERDEEDDRSKKKDGPGTVRFPRERVRETPPVSSGVLSAKALFTSLSSRRG